MRKALITSALILLSLLAPALSQAQSGALESEKPSGYLLVVGKTTDRAKIGAYATALPPIYAENDAYYLAIGGPGRGITWLEGPWRDRTIILGKFPTRAGVDRFWWGDAYRTAIRKRDGAGVFSVVALEGTNPLLHEGTGTGFLIVMTAPRDSSSAQANHSQNAAKALLEGVAASGGTLMTGNGAGQYTSLEGDTVFDRFTIAVWPTLAARDAYLASAQGRRAARLRQKLGLSAVASANGVPRNQAPPAAAGPIAR